MPVFAPHWNGVGAGVVKCLVSVWCVGGVAETVEGKNSTALYSCVARVQTWRGEVFVMFSVVVMVVVTVI